VIDFKNARWKPEIKLQPCFHIYTCGISIIQPTLFRHHVTTTAMVLFFSFWLCIPARQWHSIIVLLLHNKVIKFVVINPETMALSVSSISYGLLKYHYTTYIHSMSWHPTGLASKYDLIYTLSKCRNNTDEILKH